MRTLLSALLLTTAIPAFADTISLNTDVTAALITGQGGVVTYSAVATLPAGRHTLIAHLPDSRYGEGPLDINFAEATGIRILSQTTATQFAEPLHRDEPAALQTAIKALDTAKATLRRFEETVETKV